MNKKNLFSIGEIAKAAGITRRIILNYESKGLIKPDKKDGATGNRYYTIDTFTQIRIIRTFQSFGLSLDEIREYFSEANNLNPIIKRLETMRDKIDQTIGQLKERSSKSSEEVREITIDPQTIYCRTHSATSIADKTSILRDTALEAMQNHGTGTSRRMYFTSHTIDSPDIAHYCVVVPDTSDGEYIQHLPESKALSTIHHGAYEGLREARNRLISYANKNNIKLTGTIRFLFLEGPPQHKDNTSRYITQILAIIE